MKTRIAVTFVGLLSLLLPALSQASSLETQRPLWQAFQQLSNASMQYYLMAQSSESGIGEDFSDAILESLDSIANVQLDDLSDADHEALNQIKDVAEQQKYSAEYLFDYGYSYPAEEIMLEENLLLVRESMDNLAATLPEHEQQLATTYLAIDHALHNYLAYHGAIGDQVNPVIGRLNIGDLLNDADTHVQALDFSQSDNASFPKKWRFLHAGLQQWQDTAVLSLVKRYYPEFKQALLSEMGVTTQ